MVHGQAPPPPRVRRAAQPSLRTTHNQDMDSGANLEAFDANANEVPGDALRDPPLIVGGEGSVIWVVLDDRQLAIVDAL